MIAALCEMWRSFWEAFRDSYRQARYRNEVGEGASVEDPFYLRGRGVPTERDREYQAGRES